MVEHLSSFESLIWQLERVPEMRADFANVAVLARSPHMGRLRRRAAEVAEAFPKLGKSIAPARPLGLWPGLAGPRWVAPGGESCMGSAVRRVQLGDMASGRDAMDTAARLADAPLDPGGRLWEMVVVGGGTGDPALLVQRVHHCLADGLGWLQVAMAFTDLDRGAGRPRANDGLGGFELQPVSDAMPGVTGARPLQDPERSAEPGGSGLAMLPRLFGSTFSAIRHPTSVMRSVAELATSSRQLGMQLAAALHRGSRMLANRSGGREFATCSVSSPALMHGSRKLEVSQADLVVIAMARALGKYLEIMGEPCDELRMGYPVRMPRSDRKVGNHFFPARVVLPTRGDPPAQAREIRQRLEAARAAANAGVLEPVTAALNLLPSPLLDAAARWQLGALDFTTTVLAGSRRTRFVAGAPIVATYPFGPLLGAGMNATAITWGKKLGVGLHIDPAAIVERKVMLDCLKSEFEHLTGEPCDRRAMERPAAATQPRRPVE